MASRADIEAGKSFVRLFLKDDMTGELKKSLSSVGSMLKDTGVQVMKIGAGISAAGASILGPLTAAVSHFVSVGDDLGDMAARTKVAASVLAEFGYAATLTGTNLEAVEKSLIKMQRTIGEAATGSKAAKKSIDELGLSLAKLRGLSPDAQFQAIADALVAINDPAKRMAMAMDVFGKGAAEILPMIENLRTLREEARAEGLIPSEEAVEAASKIDDSFNKLKATVGSLMFEIGASLAEPVLTFLEMARDVVKVVRDWIKENSGLVKIVAAVGVALTVAGGIVTALGAALIGAGLAISGFATVIGAVGSAIAFLATPLGLVLLAVAAVTAALAAGVVWWAKFTESGRLAVKGITVLFGGIFKALKAGDWQLAGDIAMAALKLAWVNGTVAIEQVWSDMIQGIKDLWFAAIDELIEAWNEIAEVVGADLIEPFGPQSTGDKASSDAARRKRINDATADLMRLIELANKLGIDGDVVAKVSGVAAVGSTASTAEAIQKQKKNIITTSGAAAAAAGYLGGFQSKKEQTPFERQMLQEIKDQKRKQEKMLAAVERIAGGLVYG